MTATTMTTGAAMTMTERRARERQVHLSVVAATTLVWAASAGIVLGEMRREDTRVEVGRDALDTRPSASVASSAPIPMPRPSRIAQAPDPTLVAAGLRPAPPPRRRVVVVRRSRAS